MTDEKHTKVFIDTELTQIALHSDDPWVWGDLISVGMVSEDGKQTFYAESDAFDEQDCSLFVIDEVLPKLEGGNRSMSPLALVKKLNAWLGAFEHPVKLISDAPETDWPHLQQFFNIYNWSFNLISRDCFDIDFKNQHQKDRFEEKLATFHDDPFFKSHHALYDAKANREAYFYAISGE